MFAVELLPGTLYLLMAVPIFAVITYFFRQATRRVYRVIRNTVSQLNQNLQENLSGMSVVQLFHREERNRAAQLVSWDVGALGVFDDDADDLLATKRNPHPCSWSQRTGDEVVRCSGWQIVEQSRQGRVDGDPKYFRLVHAEQSRLLDKLLKVRNIMVTELTLKRPGGVNRGQGVTLDY